jgi:hypothetical protein
MGASLGKGAGAMLWLVIIFAAIAAMAYLATGYWSGPVPPS